MPDVNVKTPEPVPPTKTSLNSSTPDALMTVALFSVTDADPCMF
jgi:hypothetical protein